jgi:hypothetical protein
MEKRHSVIFIKKKKKLYKKNENFDFIETECFDLKFINWGAI